MNDEEFNKFFKPYAQNVDQAEQHAFWKLSDAIITEIIKKEISSTLHHDAVIFDAGGGTGRWAVNLSRIFNCNFVVFDRSNDMLEKARQNIAAAGQEERIRVVEGNLCDIGSFGENSVGHIVSIYSPISFIDEKEVAAKELFRVLKPGGKILIMGHGFFNALYSKINNYVAPAKELLDMAEDHMVKWGEHVPRLNTFSSTSMTVLLTQAGFAVPRVYGVPVFAQPGPEDWDPDNKKHSRISEALEDKDFFNAVLELEMRYNAGSNVSNRGMNIFAVGEKK